MGDSYYSLIFKFICGWCSFSADKKLISDSKKLGNFGEMFFMADALKYMIDEKGDKTSVVVPLKTWEKINNEYASLQNKLKVLTGIKDGLKEVKGARESGKKLQTVKDFLSDSNS